MFGRKRKSDDFGAEIDAHLQLEYDRQRELGLSEEEARAAARRAFGNVMQAQEHFYESHRWLWLNHFWQDVRYGVRTLRKSPGFAVIAILTLAIGIGANTALFSVVNSVLLNPLPYAQPDRLVALYTRANGFNKFSISYPNFLDWSRQNHSFASLAAFRGETFTMTGVGEPERLDANMVSATFFPLLGVNPIIGRNFEEKEDQLGAARAALISEGLWKRKFDAALDIVGKSIRLDGNLTRSPALFPALFTIKTITTARRPNYTFPSGSGTTRCSETAALGWEWTLWDG